MERGEIVFGTITHTTPFGAYVAIEDYDHRALVHISQVPNVNGWKKDFNLPHILKMGQQQEFKVLDILDDGRVNLSLIFDDDQE